MSRKHPSLEELDQKRINITAFEKAHPFSRQPSFGAIVKARKYRHDFHPCTRKECAMRNTTAEQLWDLLFMQNVDLVQIPRIEK